MSIPPYTARYEAKAYASTLEAVTDLHYSEGTARFAMSAEVSGMLRLLGRFRFERETRVALDSEPDTGRPILLETRDFRETPNRIRTSHAQIRSEEGVAIGKVGDREFSLPVPADVQDFLSSLLLVMAAVKRGDFRSGSHPITLLERDELREYRLNHDGTEILDSVLGRIETIRFVRLDEGGDPVFTAWLAKDQNAVPVRFDFDAGDRVFRMELQNLDWHVTPVRP